MKFRVCRPHELDQDLGIRDESAWHEVEANSTEEAAETYAAELCSRDPEYYSSFDGDGEVMLVRGPGETTASVRVMVEMVPSFMATRVR